MGSYLFSLQNFYIGMTYALTSYDFSSLFLTGGYLWDSVYIYPHISIFTINGKEINFVYLNFIPTKQSTSI